MFEQRGVEGRPGAPGIKRKERGQREQIPASLQGQRKFYGFSHFIKQWFMLRFCEAGKYIHIYYKLYAHNLMDLFAKHRFYCGVVGIFWDNRR